MSACISYSSLTQLVYIVMSAPELRLFKNACVLTNEGIMASNTAATVICQLFHSNTGTGNPQVLGVIVKFRIVTV